MASTTDRSIRGFVSETIYGNPSSPYGDSRKNHDTYNITNIMNDLLARYDLLGATPEHSIHDIDRGEFWSIVDNHRIAGTHPTNPSTATGRRAAIDRARDALIAALGEEGSTGYFAHLARLAHNLGAIEQTADQWNRLGDDMHKQTRAGFTRLIDTDDGESGIEFLPSPLRDAATFHAAMLRDTAYTIAGHYRRELDDLYREHGSLFGQSWREILALAVELRDARSAAELAGDPPALDEIPDPFTPPATESDGQGGIRWVDQS